MLFFLSDGNTCSLSHAKVMRSAGRISVFCSFYSKWVTIRLLFLNKSTLRVYIIGFTAGVGNCRVLGEAMWLFFFFLLHTESSQWETVPLLFLAELRSVTCWSIQRWSHQILNDDIPSRDGCTTLETLCARPPAAPSRVKCLKRVHRSQSFFFLRVRGWHFCQSLSASWREQKYPSLKWASGFSIEPDWGPFAIHMFTPAWRCGIRHCNGDMVGRVLQSQHYVFSF